jgi:hypothetical protein
MIEQWKPVSGFAYEVSSIGRVRRFGRKVLQSRQDKDGYLIVVLCRDGIPHDRKVHQLVCSAFNQPRPSKRHEVRHLNGTRSNNIPSNLKWGLGKHNAADRDRHGNTVRGERHRRARFSNKLIRGLKVEYRIAKVQAIRAGKKYVQRGFLVDLAATVGIDRQDMHRLMNKGWAV